MTYNYMDCGVVPQFISDRSGTIKSVSLCEHSDIIILSNGFTTKGLKFIKLDELEDYPNRLCDFSPDRLEDFSIFYEIPIDELKVLHGLEAECEASNEDYRGFCWMDELRKRATSGVASPSVQ